MSVHQFVIINDSPFAILDQEASPLRRALAAAVREGGAFVPVGVGGPRTVEVFVTPSTPIRWERWSRDDTQHSDAAPDAAFTRDLEWWLDSL